MISLEYILFQSIKHFIHISKNSKNPHFFSFCGFSYNTIFYVNDEMNGSYIWMQTYYNIKQQLFPLKYKLGSGSPILNNGWYMDDKLPEIDLN